MLNITDIENLSNSDCLYCKFCKNIFSTIFIKYIRYIGCPLDGKKLEWITIGYNPIDVKH